MEKQHKGKEYGVIKISDNKYRVIRIIKDFETHEEATDAMFDIMKGRKQEEDV